MIRWGFFMVLGVLLLAGCDDGPKVERKQITEPAASDPHGSTAAPGAAHGMTPPAAAAGASEDLSSPVISTGMVEITAPKGWIRKPPPSNFTRAEFALPKVEGDPADGRLTVSVAGGDLQANITRWRGQFSGKPDKDTQEQLDVGGIPVTLVDISGTFMDQRGMMGPTTTCPNYRLLGAIFDMGGQLHFIKCYGPAKTIAAKADEFKAFVRSIKKN